MKEDTRSRYVKYVKVCFLAMKRKQRDHEPSPFGPFLLTEMTHSYPFIFQLVKSLPVFILEP